MQKIIEEGTPDKRKNREGRTYFLVVKNSFELMNELLTRGDTIFSIFENLRESGIFNETAQYHSFYMAFQREGKRRSVDIRRNMAQQGKAAKKDEPPAAQGQSEHPHPSAIKLATTTGNSVVKEKTFNIIEGDDVL